MGGRGDADAQTKLGQMYANAEGAPMDGAGAVKWFREAADRGNSDAQFNLGAMSADEPTQTERVLIGRH